MIRFDKHDMQRVAVSAMGALTLSAACVFGAVAPARAEAPASLPAWQAQVENRIANASVDADARGIPSELSRADVALHFGVGGDFTGATVARSSGNKAVDAAAVKFASRLRYPELPARMRGTAQDVTMRLYFGDASSGAVMPTATKRARMADIVRHDGIQVAAR